MLPRGEIIKRVKLLPHARSSSVLLVVIVVAAWRKLTSEVQESPVLPSVVVSKEGKELSIPLRYSCVWDSNLTDCYQVLSEHIFGDTESQHHSSSSEGIISKWYFMGDSTMFRLKEAWERQHTEITQLLREPPRNKKLDQYYGIPKNESLWVPPNHSNFEGPVGRAESPFYMDCSNCKNTWLRLPTSLFQEDAGDANITTNATDVDTEWLGVEYSKDVSYPTEHGKTSQETVGWYITKQEKQGHSGRTACVVTVGLHDMKFVVKPYDMTTQDYVKQAHAYQAILQQACGSSNSSTPPLLIWMPMSAVMGKTNTPQRNSIIEDWNRAVRTTLPKGWIYMDIYPKSRKTKHTDNVHLDDSLYYEPLADVFWSLATGLEWTDTSLEMYLGRTPSKGSGEKA